MNSNLSTWTQVDVQQWLKSIKMDKYNTNFQNNQVNGYDLCYLSNDDFKDLKINNFHDKNTLLKYIKYLKLEQLKLNISYEQKELSVQLDFDPSFTVSIFSNELKDLFRINENIHLCCLNDNEILMPNLKIIDLILLNPEKYKHLKIITNSNLKYNNNTSSSYLSSNISTINQSVNNLPINKGYDKEMNDKYSDIYDTKNYNMNYQINDSKYNKDMKNNYQTNPEKIYNRENNQNYQQDFMIQNRKSLQEKDIYGLYKDFKQPMKIEENDYKLNNNNDKIQQQIYNQNPYSSIENKIYYNNPEFDLVSLNKNQTFNDNVQNYDMNRKSSVESNNMNIQRQNNFNQSKEDYNLRDNKRYSSEKRNFRSNDTKIMSEMYNRLQEANNNILLQKEGLNNIPKSNNIIKIDNNFTSNQFDSKSNFNMSLPRNNYYYTENSNNKNNISSNIINTKGGFSLNTNK